MVKVKKSTIYLGIVLSINFFKGRKNGFFIKLDNLKVIGFKNNKLLGTKLKGNCFRELKKLIFIKKKKSFLIRNILFKYTHVL